MIRAEYQHTALCTSIRQLRKRREVAWESRGDGKLLGTGTPY